MVKHIQDVSAITTQEEANHISSKILERYCLPDEEIDTRELTDLIEIDAGGNMIPDF